MDALRVEKDHFRQKSTSPALSVPPLATRGCSAAAAAHALRMNQLLLALLTYH
jgi:hypothetical protein